MALVGNHSLDEIQPFLDTVGVDVVLMKAEKMLSPHLDAVRPNNAT